MTSLKYRDYLCSLYKAPHPRLNQSAIAYVRYGTRMGHIVKLPLIGIVFAEVSSSKQREVFFESDPNHANPNHDRIRERIGAGHI